MKGLPPVIGRQGFHGHPPGHQLVSFKHRGDPVKNVLPGTADIFGHPVFKRQHPHHVKMAGSRNQIQFVGVFPRQLEGQQMAPVVQVLFIDVIVLAVLPARGLYHADRPPGLCGQKFRTQLPVGGAAAPQPVQWRKTVKSILLRLELFRKSRLIPVQHNKRAPCIIRKVFQRNEGCVLG